MSDKLVLTVKVKGVVLTSEPINQGLMNTLLRSLQRVDPETRLIMAVPIDLLGIDAGESEGEPDVEDSTDDLMEF